MLKTIERGHSINVLVFPLQLRQGLSHTIVEARPETSPVDGDLWLGIINQGFLLASRSGCWFLLESEF
jgi:hypothetical protein